MLEKTELKLSKTCITEDNSATIGEVESVIFNVSLLFGRKRVRAGNKIYQSSDLKFQQK